MNAYKMQAIVKVVMMRSPLDIYSKIIVYAKITIFIIRL